jgi:hypothetical protein
LLLKNWYSNSSEFWNIIKECDFWNKITYYTLNWEIDFIWCVDENNHMFYQNKFWEILRDDEDKIITHIDVSSIKYFWDYRIYTFINEDWEGKINIEDIKDKWVNFENCQYVDSFNIKEIWYTDFIIDETTNELVEKEEIFEYLLLNNWDERRLLDKDLQEISIMDILIFLNKNNHENIKYTEESLSRLWELSVFEIWVIYSFAWIKMIELLAEIPIWYDEDWDDIYEKNYIILLQNWNILTEETEHWKSYIRSLWDIWNFFDKDFVSFSLTDFWWVDWYIDASGKIVKIKWQSLRSIDRLSKMNWQEVYIINKKSKKLSKDDLILTKQELLEELDQYDWIEESEIQFEVLLKDNELIQIDDQFFEKVILNIGNNNLKIYLKKWNRRTKYEYKKLINQLKNTNNWQEILKYINNTLQKLWY